MMPACYKQCRRGHGKRASVAGYGVGGKTGTSQVAKQHAKGYEEGKYIGSFWGLPVKTRFCDSGTY